MIGSEITCLLWTMLICLEPISEIPPPAIPAISARPRRDDDRAPERYAEEEQRWDCWNYGNPSGLRLFSRNASFLLGAVALATVSSSRLALRENPSQRGLEVFLRRVLNLLPYRESGKRLIVDLAHCHPKQQKQRGRLAHQKVLPCSWRPAQWI
jgi:hypothetical protein